MLTSEVASKEKTSLARTLYGFHALSRLHWICPRTSFGFRFQSIRAVRFLGRGRGLLILLSIDAITAGNVKQSQAVDPSRGIASEQLFVFCVARDDFTHAIRRDEIIRQLSSAA